MKFNIEDQKFVGIKLKSLDSYIWFETANVIHALSSFIGKEGVGKDNSRTNIKCRDSEIESYIYSDNILK